MKKQTMGGVFLKLLGVLFLLYLSITIAINTGYYEAKLSEKTTITNEAMKRFEEDIRNGRDVDITDYITEIHQDYSNQTTRAGAFFSSTVESFMSKGIHEIVNVFKMLFT